MIALSAPARADMPDPATFPAWREAFAQRLEAEGVRADVRAAMLEGLEPDLRIVERDRTQPEFVRPIWQYLAGAASAERAAGGRRAAERHAGALDQVAARFEVEREILTAIWGLESAYGAIQGDFDVVRSLATLAWEGRRRAFAEAQLIAAARMIERGYATRAELKGSWAGAMGQTQFIPTTYLERAVDVDGDGRRNIWTSEADALGSAANLLVQAGWERGAPVAVRTVLPEDFDYQGWNENTRRPLRAWALDGLRPASGEWAADDLHRTARLILPAGAAGPAFMAFGNFEALMRYNNSTAYGLGVAYLARRLEDGTEPPGGWPENDPPINRTQSRELQEALTALGYDTRGVDGIVGANTRAALKRFQAGAGLTPDGYAGRRAYDAVMAAHAQQGQR
ncbi:lytic murein transglycosylase [Alkalicaulis satelles]|uniref:Lytic murein transglycosylase n=2 Tax=Alkalicaulis satelles TaxID=2609175 RepID=A0A5M6ZK56_9PROT|nr:lytic murein transglycosylase [Alkalicaulis satelles]